VRAILTYLEAADWPRGDDARTALGT